MWQHKEKIAVAIVDDHPIVIQGLRTLLENHEAYTLAGCFTTGGSVMEFLSSNKADIVLLDITLPDGSGIDFCKEISRLYPDIRIVALSNLSERSIITQLFNNGAHGYLLKNCSAKELLDSIEETLQGTVVMSAEVREIMSQPDLNVLQTIPELTKREKQILALLADGKRSPEIAEQLFISPLTVKTHRATLLHKFQVNNIVNLVNRARECGLA